MNRKKFERVKKAAKKCIGIELEPILNIYNITAAKSKYYNEGLHFTMLLPLILVTPDYVPRIRHHTVDTGIHL